MSVNPISMSGEGIQSKSKLERFIYLPSEGLQGEDIPSHILWKDANVESIRVSFQPPLKLKDVFNAESWETHDCTIDIRKVELDGYVGLSFESSKVTPLEVVVPVNYAIRLSNGCLVKESKKIGLFRPKLEAKIQSKKITVNPNTGYVKGRVRIRNIGRGTLMLNISTTKGSSTQLETPPEHREFSEKFLADLMKGMNSLAEEFPQFQSVLEDMEEWAAKDEGEMKDITALSNSEKEELQGFIKTMANVLATDRNLVRRFAETYMKAFTRNTEYLEAIGKFLKIYQSLVSKDLFLVNPFDEIILKGKEEGISLKIAQTDRVFGTYKNVVLPKVEVTSPQPTRLPIYRLFDWG